MPRAPKKCGRADCETRVTGRSYCPDHTEHGWASSPRRSQLPPDWRKIRGGVLDRAGYRCVALLRDGTRCTAKATEVDHRTPRGPDTPDNLQALCTWHHKRKTQRESAAARGAGTR
jgi:5-methylcytosine-specific restriction enzyme A